MSSSKDLFGLEDVERTRRDEYEQLRLGLYALIEDFAQERDISDAYLALLLLDLGVSARMVAYMHSVEKPSGSGLKLELDRFRREIDDFIRGSKKTVDAFVAESMKLLAEAEAGKRPA